MGVAILVSNCKGCINSGIAWIDLARLQDCVRLRGPGQLIASWSFNFANYHANQDLLYMCKAKKWLPGKNAFSHAFPHAFLPCFPSFPRHKFLATCLRGYQITSLQDCMKVFLHGAWPRFARARLHAACIQGFKLLLVRLRLTTK